MKQNKKLQKNLDTINNINPELVTWIKKEKDVDWFEKIKSKNNDDNLIIRSGSQYYPAYCMKNPVKEAKKAVKKMDLHKEDISILMGIGIGYLTNEILKKMEDGHRLIVIEPVASILKLALSKFDFSQYFKKGKFLLVTPGADTIENKIQFALHYLSSEAVINSWPFTIEMYTKKRPNEYGSLIKYTSNVLNQILCNTGTIAGAAGGIIADNDINCLPYVIRHRGVAEIKDLYKDKPAVLVSTGPSLAKNIHRLIDVQDKVIIIAVGQALRVLLAYGITPDFICTVDFGEVNYVHFKGLMDSTVPLVTINRTYAKLIKAYQGPKFIAATPVPGFEDMATGILTNKGFIESGGSVAHLVFGTAQLLGCNPITFIGQDLSLGTTSHIALADAGGEVLVGEDGLIGWKVTDQRCHLHGDEIHGMGYAHNIPGYYGNYVTTNAGLMSFLTVFESMIQRRTDENKDFITVNSTEGGAKIKGTVQLSLKEYIEKYCQETIDKSIIKPLLTFAEDGDKLIEDVIPLLQKDIDNLDDIIVNSRKGIAVSHGLKVLMSRSEYTGLLTKKKEKAFEKLNQEASLEAKNRSMIPETFFEKAINSLSKSKLKTIMILSHKNFIFSEIAHVAAIRNPLVNVAIYGASRQIAHRDLKVDSTVTNFLKNKKNAITRTERNIIILKAAKTSAESLKKSYKKTLKLLKKYNKTKDNNLLISNEVEKIDLKDAESYFEKGNWAHPLLDTEKLFNGYEKDKVIGDGEPLYDKAVKIHDKAIRMREEAIQKAKDSEAENYDKMNVLLEYNILMEDAKKAGRDEQDFFKALDLMKKAVELMPDEQEARWGLATALHHAGELDESINEYKKLIEQFPENHKFLYEYGQVLLRNNQLQEGLKEIGKAMEQTDEYDNFLIRLGEIYEEGKMFDEAVTAYTSYLNKYPFNFEAWYRKGKCLELLGRLKQAEKAYRTCYKIKPDYKKGV